SSAVLKQLDRQHADVVKRLKRPRGDGGGLVGQRSLGGRRGGGRQAQDPIAVDVFDERPKRRFAGAAARGKDRQLALERNETLEKQRTATDRRERGIEILGAAQHALPLAVVPLRAGLEHGR